MQILNFIYNIEFTKQLIHATIITPSLGKFYSLVREQIFLGVAAKTAF